MGFSEYDIEVERIGDEMGVQILGSDNSMDLSENFTAERRGDFQWLHLDPRWNGLASSMKALEWKLCSGRRKN